MQTSPDAHATIGVFDSGIGGLSVLRALRAALPHEQFVYYADSAHAPYGEKAAAFVLQRSLAITDLLRHEHGIKALVVACNTATAAAIARLRELHPDLIIIGIEPALKPAALASRSKQVAVLATRGTLASAKFQALLAAQSAQAHFHCQPCDGLAEAIETHIRDLTAPALAAQVHRYLTAVGLIAAHTEIDTVVLGCTHYPLIKAMFQSQLAPHIAMVDNGLGVANQLALRLGQQALLLEHSSPLGTVQFVSSALAVQDWATVLNA